jgi:DNA-directed RNA polymerase subunit M/transcription elongation factor TFIIS
MKFCKADGKVMTRDTSTGKVKFICICGKGEDGKPEDSLILTQTIGISEVKELYRTLINNAEHDRTNILIAKDCPNCGLDRMAQIRVGVNEVVVYKCKCGAEYS